MGWVGGFVGSRAKDGLGELLGSEVEGCPREGGAFWKPSLHLTGRLREASFWLRKEMGSWCCHAALDLARPPPSAPAQSSQAPAKLHP